MKKGYIKPSLTCEQFAVNECISACRETSTYNPVRVDCVITKHHHIFYSGCETVTNCTATSDCDGGIHYDNATIVSYGGDEYLVWSGSGNSGGRAGGNNSNMQLLNAIIAAGVEQGLFPEGTTGQGKHAGLITPDIQTGINHS